MTPNSTKEFGQKSFKDFGTAQWQAPTQFRGDTDAIPKRHSQLFQDLTSNLPETHRRHHALASQSLKETAR